MTIRALIALAFCMLVLPASGADQLKIKLEGQWATGTYSYQVAAQGQDNYGVYGDINAFSGGSFTVSTPGPQILHFGTGTDSSANGSTHWIFRVVPGETQFTGGGDYTTNYPNAGNTYYATFVWVPQCPPRTIEYSGIVNFKPRAGSAFVAGSYTISVVIDGETVETGPVNFGNGTVPGNIPVTVSGSYSGRNGDATIAIKVNGTTVATRTYTCYEELAIWNFNVPYQTDGQPQTETTKESESPGTTPDTTQTTKTNTNTDQAGNTASNSTTKFSDAAKTDLSKSDMYDVVRAAMIDAGNSGSFPGPGSSGESFGVGQTGGEMPGVQSELNGLATENQAVKDGLLEVADFSDRLDWLPDQSGKVSTMDFGSFTFGGTFGTGDTIGISANLQPFMPAIDVLRNIFLVFLLVAFVLWWAQLLLNHV